MERKRTYRTLVQACGRQGFEVRLKETDMLIHAPGELKPKAFFLVEELRDAIETWISDHPDFATSLYPLPVSGNPPQIVKEMLRASEKANVGPMAAVAGAISEGVGRGLLEHAKEIIVENGGDIFIKTKHPVTIGIYAGKSVHSMKLGIRIAPAGKMIAVCTSSGTVGHSLSMGRADAVTIVSEKAALADAAATAVGNRISGPLDIQPAIAYARKIKGVEGVLVILKDKIGAWGRIELVPL